jgi:antitoxin component of MazEF toxin-antitoxin module
MLTKTVKIRKRGNGLWITIPAAIVKALDLKPGQNAEFTVTGEHEFVVSFASGDATVTEQQRIYCRVVSGRRLSDETKLQKRC